MVHQHFHFHNDGQKVRFDFHFHFFGCGGEFLSPWWLSPTVSSWLFQFLAVLLPPLPNSLREQYISKNDKKTSFWHLAQRGTHFLFTLFLHRLIHEITCMYLCSDRTLLLAKYSTSIFLLPTQSASALTKYFYSWKFLASALRSLSAQGDETLVSRCALCNYCVASKTSDKWKENMEQSKANQSSLWVGERGQEQQRHRYLPRCTIRDAPTTQQPTTTNSTQQPNNNKNQPTFQQQQPHQHPLQQPNMQGLNNHPKTTKFTT